MNVDDLKPFPVGRFGGQVDYQDPTKVINGCALLAQMVRFLPDQVGTCFGTVDTMKRQQPYEEVTGINVLDVLGVLNPGQIPVVFGDQGSLLQESPAGSGALIPLEPPFPLPAGSYMRSTDAENTMTMAISDGTKGLVPPLRLNGVNNILSSPQNPIGGLWSQDLIYQLGDLVRSADGRWWRCTQSGSTFGSGSGPQWPKSNGYFAGAAWTPATATDPVGGSAWEEWTPNCVQFLPAPDVTGATITADSSGHLDPSKDIYIQFTYLIPQSGETPRSVPLVWVDTHSDDRLTVTFGGGPTAGPFMPRWLAEINLQFGLFYPFTLNVWIAVVDHGADAPAYSDYGLYASEQSVGAPVVISSPTTVAPAGQGVVNVEITGGGAYSAVPTVSFVGGGGSGAAGFVTYRTIIIHSGGEILISYIVTGVAITSPGSGYTSAPAVVFDPGGAVGTAILGSAGAPSGSSFPQGCWIVWLNPLTPSSFIGEFGQRYMIVTRFNKNGSLAPVDPNSAIPVNFVGQLQLPIVTILRDSSGNVSCTVGDVTVGWAIGNDIEVEGCTGDATFNGSFQLNNVQPTLSPQGILSWKDPDHLSASNDETGSVTLPAGPVPVAFLPPGGPNDLEDIAAFTVANPPQQIQGAQAGPFFYISEAPENPYSSPIVAMEGALALDFSSVSLTRDAGGFVSATLPDIAGLAVGNLVTITESTDPSFNGSYSLAGVSPGTGTAGELTWEQADLNASTGTAELNVVIGESSSVQITVEDASGFQAGDTCLPLGVPSAFAGQVTIATITGNVLTVTSLATGSATISPGATLQRLQNLPTASAAAPQAITSITRDAAGNVQAEVGDVGGYAAGQVVSVEDVTDPSFDSPPSFELLGVQVNDDGVTGTLSWAQPGVAASSSSGGTVGSVPDMLINYQDELLEDEQDNEVTDQLNMSPPPPAADVYFVPSLQMYVYTRGIDSVFLFSQTDDAENVDLENGSLSVDDNSMSLAICVREARTGEIIAMKADGGYAINPSDLAPSEWPCPTRWSQHGPPCAGAVGKGKDFLVFPSFWTQAGCYLYIDGKLDWLTKEFQKTWDRVNRDALNTIWTIVDEQEKEIQIGLPLDGATTPSHIAVGSYIEGFGPQEVLNRYGKLITARSAIRWSIRPRATRAAAVVQRALAAPQESLSVAYPFTSISRTGGMVTASYAGSVGGIGIESIVRSGGAVTAHVSAVVDPSTAGIVAGATVPVVGVGDSSFDGDWLIEEVVEIRLGIHFAFNIFWAQAGADSVSSGGTIGGTPEITLPPVIVPGGAIEVENTPDASFDGEFLTVASTASTLSWIQNPVAPPVAISNWSWAGGLSGSGVGALMIMGQIPAGVVAGNSLYLRGTNSLLDGKSFVTTSIVQGTGYYTVIFELGVVFATDVLSGLGGLAQFFIPAPNATSGMGDSYMTTLVPTPTTDERVQARQVLLAPSGSSVFDTVKLISADRRTGLRGDGSTGGVITLRFSDPLDGDVSDVVVSGMSDESFDGEYDEPCTAAWGSDGTHSILQFKTSGLTGVAFGGTIQSTLPVLRVVMQDPTRLDDNGVALDSRYTPAFAQAGGMIVLRWGAYNIQVLGQSTNGGPAKVLVTPQTEDPNAVFNPDEIVATTAKPKRIQSGLRVPDNEYLTLEISNDNQPGQGFVLQDLTIYGVPVFTGRRS